MKKVYIPEEEELYNLEKLGVNLYYYLITKTIESMVMADVIYEEEDMFEIAYDEFSDIPQIIYAIARMYPERITESSQASNDVKLCKKIIPTLTKGNKSIYGLDQMRSFKTTVLENPEVMEAIIKTLVENLKTSPRYRFEYSGPNETLDKIFGCELDTQNMNFNTFKTLAVLDPIYLAKRKSGIILPEDAVKSITQYASIYGVDAYGVKQTQFTSMINNADKNKRLIRRLNIHKQYYDL